MAESDADRVTRELSDALDEGDRRARPRIRDPLALAFAEWIDSLAAWHLMVTITVDPRRRVYVPPGTQRHGQRLRDPVPGHMATDVFGRVVARRWRDCEDALGRPLIAATGVEFHRSGAPHAHAVVSVQGGVRPGDIATIGRVFFETLGFCRVEEPRDAGDCSRYVSKYVTKSNPDQFFLHPRAGRLHGYLEPLMRI